jgi:hypothetical protein
MPQPEDETFRSVGYPGIRPWPLVLAQEGVRPLAYLMLPLMVVTLVVALSAGNLLPLVIWAYPILMLVAAAWSAFSLERQIGEVIVESGSVRMLSIADCALARKVPPVPLYDVRDYGGWLVVAAGDSDFVLEREKWPDFERMRTSLRSQVYPAVV